MSFLFGGGSTQASSKQDVDNILSIINGKDETEQAKMVTNITLEATEIHGYYKLNLLDFFEDIYANVRPRNFEVNIVNYNDDLVENVDVYYLHTPIPDAELEVSKLSQFTNHIQFTKKTTIKNQQPYLTFCQLDEEDNITDIDISQTTNVNLIPSRRPFVSLGALIFQLNRKTSGNVTLELTITLNYSIKKY